MTITIYKGDVLEQLRLMADDSVDCIMTSPPYWGLRDYGVEGQLGLEKSLGEHLEAMVAVFEECRRVLKPTGSVWLNYGDCYASEPNGRSAADTKAAGTDDRTFRDKPFSTIGPINRNRDIPRGSGRWGGGNNPAGGVLKPKDLAMIPNRLAIALQEAGWWVRSEIIWAKPNAMPDSSGVRRPATAHEKIFLLSKSGKATCWMARDTGEWAFEEPDLSQTLPIKRGKKDYTPRWAGFDFYYNSEEVAQAVSPNTNARLSQDVMSQIGSARANGGGKTNGNMKAVLKKQDGHGRRHNGFNDRWDKKMAESGSGIRYNESYAASVCMPTDNRFLRNYEPAFMQVWEIATAACREAHFATFPPELVERCLKAGCPPGGLVLDPFGGSGTTGMVAEYMGMNASLIELNPEYIKIAWRRIKDAAPLTTDLRVEGMTQAELFST